MGTIASKLLPEHLDIIECGLFNKWPQQGPVHKGFLSFGNVVCQTSFDGAVTVEKVEEGIALTHRVDGAYKGLWPYDSSSESMTDDNKRNIIYTEDFNGYRISDANPGQLVLLCGNIEVNHGLSGEDLVLAVDYAAAQLCTKLALRIR